MNINDPSALRACTSCQMCAAVCPKDAISFTLDKAGFYRPLVDANRCIDCSLCTRVCYKFDEGISDYNSDCLAGTTLLGVSAKADDVVKETTSGGVADLLARELLKQGYKCVGVVYDGDTDRAVDRIASDEEDLIAFRGSKYIQSYTLDAFRQIVKNCRKEKYAVFGTPCHIYALDTYLRQRKVRDNFMLIDLYCHGCPSMHVWSKYIKSVKSQLGLVKVDNANFRSKVKGWGNFYVVVVVDGKPVYYSNQGNNEFFKLFFSDQVLNEACHDCKLRSTLQYTDIRLGDFWGKQYVLNNRGVSAVSLVTERAKLLFANLLDKVDAKEERYEDFLPWQSWGKEHHPNENLRNELLSQLSDDKVALSQSVQTLYSHQSLKGKMIRYGKSFVHLLPPIWEKRVRWFFYKL